MKIELQFFWIFFIGGILNIVYSIYVFIVSPQDIAYLCFSFGIIYILFSLLFLCCYHDEKIRSKRSIKK